MTLCLVSRGYRGCDSIANIQCPVPPMYIVPVSGSLLSSDDSSVLLGQPCGLIWGIVLGGEPLRLVAHSPRNFEFLWFL